MNHDLLKSIDYRLLRLSIWTDCHLRRIHNWRVDDRGRLACRWCRKECDL